VVNRSFKRVLRHTGLPNIRFHDLWHTCATLMLGIGLNPKVAQKRIAHSNQAVCNTVPQPR
jgi:integrase